MTDDDFRDYYGSPWMPRYCTRVEASPAMPLAEARATEKREISRCRPVFNKHHNPDPTPWVPVWRPDGPSLKFPEIVWLDSLPTERQTA